MDSLIIALYLHIASCENKGHGPTPVVQVGDAQMAEDGGGVKIVIRALSGTNLRFFNLDDDSVDVRSAAGDDPVEFAVENFPPGRYAVMEMVDPTVCDGLDAAGCRQRAGVFNEARFEIAQDGSIVRPEPQEVVSEDELPDEASVDESAVDPAADDVLTEGDEASNETQDATETDVPADEPQDESTAGSADAPFASDAVDEQNEIFSEQPEGRPEEPSDEVRVEIFTDGDTIDVIAY